MVDHLKRHYFVPTLAAVLMAGCSPGANRTSSSEHLPANANAAPSVSQNAPPASNAQPPATTQLAPGQPPDKREAKPALEANVKTVASTTPAPKLVLPLNDIDFGKVAQGKSLTRNLVVKNAGKANLNIESVSPS
jgi:hypothetical protein